jgi:hypothetical protein
VAGVCPCPEERLCDQCLEAWYHSRRELAVKWGEIYVEQFWCNTATVEQRAQPWPRNEKSRWWCARRVGGVRDERLSDIVTRAISGHATETMQRHYSTVASTEVRAGLAKVIDIATGRERSAA